MKLFVEPIWRFQFNFILFMIVYRISIFDHEIGKYKLLDYVSTQLQEIVFPFEFILWNRVIKKKRKSSNTFIAFLIITLISPSYRNYATLKIFIIGSQPIQRILMLIMQLHWMLLKLIKYLKSIQGLILPVNHKLKWPLNIQNQYMKILLMYTYVWSLRFILLGKRRETQLF